MEQLRPRVESYQKGEKGEVLGRGGKVLDNVLAAIFNTMKPKWDGHY